ncbi:pyridoxine 5'-phosphate synthase [bacterium]|nr:pyridoxine 5'-phosphate synthase [bacterium]
MSKLRLGVNIDHVATIRNARGHRHPDPLKAALLAVKAGADGITAHLREDRRHISDSDVKALIDNLNVPLNLEMAATPEMLAIALATKPHAVCLVPEKRQEVTTEGGLDVAGQRALLADYIDPLKAAGIRVSLFVDPEAHQLEVAMALGAPVVELHTGTYCETAGDKARHMAELKRIQQAARIAQELGLECHAGHGLTYDTVGPIAAIPTILELNIGHFLIGEAIFMGLEQAINTMRHHMDAARGKAAA